VGWARLSGVLRSRVQGFEDLENFGQELSAPGDRAAPAKPLLLPCPIGLRIRGVFS